MSHKTKTPNTIDPYAKREAKNYDNPIVSREFLLDFIAKQSAPVHLKHVAEALNYEDEEQIEGLRRRLQAMVRDGQIFKNRRDGYMDFNHMDLITGTVQAHPDGFGFLIPDEGGKDIFLHSRQMSKLLNGDKIAVKIFQFDERRSRPEGELVKIIKRAHTQVIGRYVIESGIRYVMPDDKRLNHDILVSDTGGLQVEQNDVVVIEITDYPRFKHQAVGVLKQVLGQDNAPGMEVTIALNTHHIPHQWNEDVLAQTQKFSDHVTAKETKGRLDLRSKPFVTIDGADARDFDDAVYCETTDSGFKLWVAIADVSHYVDIDSPLDQEATARGTSVYFPGEVIPMLPEALSNSLCSLNPHVDRLTMVCEMNIGPQGAIKEYIFHEAVIYSHHRLTYDQAAAMVFDGDADLSAVKVDEAKPQLETLKSVYQALQKARKRRKALEFDTQEVVFEYNDERKIEAIHPIQRNEAHQLIEECMVSANICAAKFLKKHKIPALYRNHAGPNPKKIDDLQTFLGMHGIRMNGSSEELPTVKDYAQIIEAIKKLPDFELLQTVLLRSMLQASYSPDKTIGHFGLALKDYAHFTSPIRRYPDLLVHRGIRHVLRGGTAKDFHYSIADMDLLGESCSSYERRADEATRDAADYLKCEFLSKHLGNQFDGRVTTVTSFGLFVQINDLLIDGLVHVTSLERDYYQFDAGKQRLVGEKTGQTFKLGDLLRVQVVRVDMQDKKIDFQLVNALEALPEVEELAPLVEKTIKKKDKTKTQRATIYKKAAAKTPKKRAQKKIKLSKQEKKQKAKKQRKETVKKAKPKHEKRKNREKGKPKRLKAKQQGE